MDTIQHTAGDMNDALSEKIQELDLPKERTELEKEQKKLLIPAMEAAGYRYKEQGQSGWNFKVYAGWHP